IPLAVAIIYAGGWVLGAVIALLAAGGAAELYRLAAERGTRPFVVAGAVIAAALVLVATAAGDHASAAGLQLHILFGATLVLLAAAIWLRGVEGGPLGATAITVFGALFVGVAFSYVVLLRALGSAGDGAPLSALQGATLVAYP